MSENTSHRVFREHRGTPGNTPRRSVPHPTPQRGVGNTLGNTPGTPLVPGLTVNPVDLLAWNAAIARARADYEAHPLTFDGPGTCAKCAGPCRRRERFCWPCKKTKYATRKGTR